MDLLSRVDNKLFSKLFLEDLGWNKPSQSSFSIECSDGNTYKLTQVAEFKGMGIWQCDGLPEPKIQREIDAKIALKNTERLVIYSNNTQQEWRWPRYRANQRTGKPVLVAQRHTIGQPNSALQERLEQILIPFGAEITVPELLHKMRHAFETEAEIASRAAARLMGVLYDHLETGGMDDEASSLFLSRMLFLMFGDDTEMWNKNIFYRYLTEATKPDGSDLEKQLNILFKAANTDIKNRNFDVDQVLDSLPYINGGIFSNEIEIKSENKKQLRDSLIEASRFDWSQISPAVFGAMFQTVKSREDRHNLGEHYTSEDNILKALGPLFLDDLNSKLDSCWNDVKRLEKLRAELGLIKILDPACGCGNFLIVAYRELRELELEILKRLKEIGPTPKGEKIGEQKIIANADLKVSIENFYGIEIEAWPAAIAETAMFLVDHQANMRMEGELGTSPRRLPIDVTSHILHANALKMDWESFLDFDQHTFIVGNPPFLGARVQTATQKAETNEIWRGIKGAGDLDYVSNWHLKASKLVSKYECNAAFVSTNSITQGEQPGIIFKEIFSHNVKISFAHRSFPWKNDAQGQATVHCVIIGLTKQPNPVRRLWIYTDQEPEPVELQAKNINAYLLDAPDLLITARQKPISTQAEKMDFGSMPNDGGYLSDISSEEASLIKQRDPIAAKFLRKIIGSRELIHNEERYCIWLKDVDFNLISGSSELLSRVEAVKNLRLNSKREATRRLASKPAEFAEIRQPSKKYIAVPSVSSNLRDYIPMAVLEPEVIANNLILVIPIDSIATFSWLQSSVFNVWNDSVSGRLGNGYRISVTVTYNNFPLPELNLVEIGSLEESASKILNIRKKYQDFSLANLYDTKKMPKDLLEAHKQNDEAVLSAFGLSSKASDSEILSCLFAKYEKLISAESVPGVLF